MKVPRDVGFRQALAAETDRGCALFVTSYLEQMIKELLAARLVDDPKILADILRPDGPVGTFSASINMVEANIDKEPDEETAQKIRAIGQILWDAGGIDMMRAVFYPVVNSVRIPEFNTQLSSLWSGVGTWRH